MDFIDLNNACPKDSFPLPPINLIVDSIAGHNVLSFMDTYFRYNQIHMSLEYEEKIIGRNVEVYIDNLLVKIWDPKGHSDDLQEAFVILWKYGMKLNPTKCTFGVGLGKFLGFMALERGIEVNVKKIQAMLDMKSPEP
ncbi:uncharacterized protein LOC122293730 [Carya illinoinensis]|uniref:uncharacterized protein LOC122293730 n=1 Tax=Carya illinoinensis TaxID=32201 RepID=UPI001C71FE02|nr:uncharacterized protein LOC122293730 [Carya illinoinensis]